MRVAFIPSVKITILVKGLEGLSIGGISQEALRKKRDYQGID